MTVTISQSSQRIFITTEFTENTETGKRSVLDVENNNHLVFPSVLSVYSVVILAQVRKKVFVRVRRELRISLFAWGPDSLQIEDEFG